jgi:ubiquinone/menaquinone biosynthesis C-methylase UbiE
MGLYSERILPHLIRSTMRNERFAPYRRRAVSSAVGRVLEIGIGSGENLPFYGTSVTEVIGLEPSARLAVMAELKASDIRVPLRLLRGSAEAVPLDTGSIDTVVITWTLCSVPDPGKALREIRRILKPAGRLLFAEHGLAPDRGIRFVQRRLTPLWKHVAGGCHLDRDMPAIVGAAGFSLERLDMGYMPGARPLSFIYEGAARPA